MGAGFRPRYFARREKKGGDCGSYQENEGNNEGEQWYWPGGESNRN